VPPKDIPSEPEPLVQVDADDLSLLLQAAGRYVAGSAEPVTDAWEEWFQAMMDKYAVSAGYERIIQPLPMDAPEGKA
jgi:hypothetical protein